jgi:rhomboid family GlyGly-CTERM serine protease
MLLEGLAFSREAIAAGEVWRLAGAGFAHLTRPHLAGNLALFAATLVLLQRSAGPLEVVGVLAFCTFATTGGLWFGSTLDWYAGASGPLYGLLAWGAARLPWPAGPGLFAGIGLIVLLDQGRSVSWLGEPLAPEAHYWGLAGGLAVLLGAALVERSGARAGAAFRPGSELGFVPGLVRELIAKGQERLG